MYTGAHFSSCRQYRYSLWRQWGSSLDYVMFIGLNPSTADETRDDPTVRRCIAFAKAWGFSNMCMTNLSAIRATDPRVMLAHLDPVGPENDQLLIAMARVAGIVVAAWGVHGTHRGRGAQVRAMIPGLHVLRLTKEGHPAHPLYLPKTLKPVQWK